MTPVDFSIVITTYNRSAVVERLLQALDAQGERDFQVVVAIDGSTDDTEAMLARQRPGFDLKWVNTHCTGYGLALARNAGILAADGRVVAVLDDDSFPEPGFIAAHRDSARPGVITGGPRRPSDPADTRMMAKVERLSTLPPLMSKTIRTLDRERPDLFLIENNISLLREDWIAMGLFSERMKIYGFIGQEFFARARFLDLSYQYNPAAAIVHHGEMEGDNGLQRAGKVRQTRLAALLRPTLMTPRHFRAQIAWARARADGAPEVALPPWRLQAGLALPWRWLRTKAAETRRGLRDRIRRSGS